MSEDPLDAGLAALGEFGLIDRIRRRAGIRAPGTVLGIGDDAAILVLEPDQELLITTDMLLEGVHFRRDWGSWDALGRKTLAVNVSDIAAMGGSPRQAFLGLGVPGDLAIGSLEQFLDGLEAAAAEWGVTLAGGDTCRSAVGLVLSVTLTGAVAHGRAVRRSGARPGDRVWVTGQLGASAAGLLALSRGLRPGAPWPAGLDRPAWLGPAEQAVLQTGIAAHLTPAPRVAAGQALLGCAHAMLDLSDGVASDLAHVCRESGVAARIFATQILVHPAARVAARWSGQDALTLALSGGEDYELLFAADEDPTARLRQAVPTLPVTAIGRIEAGAGTVVLELPGGAIVPLRGGFDHFRSPVPV